MWSTVKGTKEFYEYRFTLFIDGEFYTGAKVSVFEPENVFDVMKNELSKYLKNFFKNKSHAILDS